jgi:hypothetical protein
MARTVSSKIRSFAIEQRSFTTMTTRGRREHLARALRAPPTRVAIVNDRHLGIGVRQAPLLGAARARRGVFSGAGAAGAIFCRLA